MIRSTCLHRPCGSGASDPGAPDTVQQNQPGPASGRQRVADWPAWRQEQDRPRALLLLAIAATAMLGYLVLDIRLGPFWQAIYLGLRSLCAALLAAAWLAHFRRWHRARAWTIAASLAVGAFLLFRYGMGHGYDSAARHLSGDVAAVLVIFLLPQPFGVQLAAAGMILGGNLMEFLREGTPERDAVWQVGLALALTLAAGIAVARDRERDLYARWQALSELRRLQSIIPICAWCKDIRTDEGAWERLEAWFGRHAEASFSHGICPECARRFDQDTGEPTS